MSTVTMTQTARARLWSTIRRHVIFAPTWEEAATGRAGEHRSPFRTALKRRARGGRVEDDPRRYTWLCGVVVGQTWLYHRQQTSEQLLEGAKSAISIGDRFPQESNQNRGLTPNRPIKQRHSIFEI